MDVMLDFETFGTNANACVVQVGACYFSRTTGKVGHTFLRNVDAQSAVNSGATMDAETIYWWLQQDKEAIKSITEEPMYHIRAVFEDLNDYLANATAIWCHSSFDFSILMETLKRLNIKPKFKYSLARDIRTLVDLSKLNYKKIPRKGIHHNALDDCKHQVTYCLKALKKIKV